MKMGFLALACLLLATFAGAFTVPAPMAEVRFNGQPVEYAFTATNDSRTAEPLTASMQIVNYLVIEKPAFVQPNETVNVRLKLLPRNDLLGTTYQSTLTIKLGEETKEFPVTLIFAEAADETATIESPSAPAEPVAAEKPAPTPASNPIDEAAEGVSAALVVMPQLSQEAMSELLFNVALAVIAALLLISFLARLTKRMVERRG